MLALGTPTAHVALIEHDYVESLSCQAFRDECSADSSAQDNNIAGDVLL